MQLTSPSVAFMFFHPLFMGTQVEEFWVAALNSEKRVLDAACLFRGTVDLCLFHPRDVFRFGCRTNASSLIVAHNHPSGSPEPSSEDVEITKRLVAAGEILQMPVVDHLIVANTKFYSFLQSGRMPGIKDLAWPGGRSPG